MNAPPDSSLAAADAADAADARGAAGARGGRLEPYAIMIAALGGEGGGVLADWLVECGLAAGLAIQATSVPGVAQRTGATSYYLEMLREPLPPGSPAPVFALYPSPGRVDVLVASEALEAARTFERGFVAPDRTVLIASTHRVYTTLEKMHMADGRYDAARIDAAAQALARRVIRFDMEELARRHRTLLSAVLFGALSGAGVLPWPRALCEEAIRRSGRGFAASLAGFAAAWELAVGSAPVAAAARAVAVAGEPLQILRDAGCADLPEAAGWQAALSALPPALRATAAHGTARCFDYQDAAYASQYLARLAALVAAAGAAGEMPGSTAGAALDEAARQLALWMCYEDIVRVADLKSRPARAQRVRGEAEAGGGDVVRIVEYLKPGIDELAAMLPRRAGVWLLTQAARRPWLRKLQFGLHLRSSSVWGHLLLRMLARLAPVRRRSLRFAEEHGAIEGWLAALVETLPDAPGFALQLAGLPQVLKGYGDTQLRGRRNYARLWAEQVAPLLRARGGARTDGVAVDSAAATAATAATTAAAALGTAIATALAQPEAPAAARPQSGRTGGAGAGSAAPAEQAIRWIRRPRDGEPT
ncbi:MAG: indolepyruvate oxidoreductase subunit beta family protein [Lautropia sp.]